VKISRVVALSLALTLAVFSWAYAGGQWVSLEPGPPKGVRISVLESSEDRTVVEFQMGGYWLDQVKIEGVVHSLIDLPGRTTLMERGLPDLPKVRERLIVPDDLHMSVRVIEADELVMEIAPVAPSKGHLPRTIDPSTIPYQFDELYQSDSWYPAQNVELGEPFILRDFRGVTLQINPFQHNPALGLLRLYRRLVVEVFADGPGRTNLKRRTKGMGRINSDFQVLYRRLFLNYIPAKYTPIT
jgi:hypothetical protein